jgi:ATP-dependent Clp protease protease subunit
VSAAWPPLMHPIANSAACALHTTEGDGALTRHPHVHAGSYSGARAAYGDYDKYPEGRPIFLPESERYGNPPDLPSLLLQQRVIYISMPVSRLHHSRVGCVMHACVHATGAMPTLIRVPHSMRSQFLPSVTELVVAQCYYLDFDDRNRSKPIYVYLNSTGCLNEKVGPSL